MCSIDPADLRVNLTRSYGVLAHGLHTSMSSVWFCRNDPKVMTHASAFPPGVTERIGAVLSELPGHIPLAYEVPQRHCSTNVGVDHRLPSRVLRPGADFGNAGILRSGPPAIVLVSDIIMSTLSSRPPYDWTVMRDRAYDPLLAYWG